MDRHRIEGWMTVGTDLVEEPLESADTMVRSCHCLETASIVRLQPMERMVRIRTVPEVVAATEGMAFPEAAWEVAVIGSRLYSEMGLETGMSLV